jgi:putative ABC transport system permease protein
MWFSSIGFAFTSLKANKLRSALTMLGVLIGVFTVTVLMSISQGAKQGVSSEIEGLGSNVLIIFPGKLDTTGAGYSGGLVGISSLTNADVANLPSAVDEIESIDASMFPGGLASNGTISASQSLIFGAGPDVDGLLGRKQAYGRWINQNDIDTNARVAVLDWITSKTLFPTESPETVVGQTITVYQQQFVVIGVDAETKDSESVFASLYPMANRVSIPLSTAQLITNTDRVNRILVRIGSTSEVQQAVKDITTELSKLHGGADDFTIMTQEDLVHTFDNVFGILNKAALGTGVVSLIVGGIGIMNIMLVAVTERTKEIGIRKAIGATDRQILVQFLIEAATLGLLGGFSGLGLSYLTTDIIDRYFNIPAVITVQSVILALAISVAAGIIFGIIPAMNAARKKPVEALHYE